MRLTLLILGTLVMAQEDYSQHQHAVAGLGAVDFPTSCNDSAQKLMSRAAALLHSFGYEEARIVFNEAATADPTCAMAYWGVARTWYHPVWAPPLPDDLKQGASALERALSIGASSERERDYINALAVFYKDWQTIDHATRAKAYEQALARHDTMHIVSSRPNRMKPAVSTNPWQQANQGLSPKLTRGAAQQSDRHPPHAAPGGSTPGAPHKPLPMTRSRELPGRSASRQTAGRTSVEPAQPRQPGRLRCR
jgi:hypothetical protein